MIRYLLALLACLFGSSAWAQQIAAPNPPAGVACAYNTTLPILTTNFAGWIQCTSNGVLLTASGPTSSASAAIAPVVSGSASSGVILKASAGNLYSVSATCSAACWLMVFNSATVPSNGSTTAGIASGNLQECIGIASGATGIISTIGGPPESFTTGISAAISSTACATLTLATTGFIRGSVQ